ncbi:MAG: hypothetical protein NW218_06200 [Saprospiraceae bacterium]|nr:hypothetical protein [Saprospiraceae bacterium]
MGLIGNTCFIAAANATDFYKNSLATMEKASGIDKEIGEIFLRTLI